MLVSMFTAVVHAGSATVVTRRDLAPAHVLTASDLEVREVPLLVPATEGFADVAGLVGRTLRRPVWAGESVRARDVADPEFGSGVAACTPVGMRAVRVQVDPGRARVHDAVDVYASRPQTQLLYTAAAVLEVHDDGLTLAVTPPHVLQILHDPSTLDVAVRNPATLSGARSRTWGADWSAVGSGPDVVVVARDLAPGVRIAAEDLTRYPLETADDAAPERWLGLEAVVGRVAAANVDAGEPLRVEHLATESDAVSLPDGHVWVGDEAIPVGEVAGHIQKARESR